MSVSSTSSHAAAAHTPATGRRRSVGGRWLLLIALLWLIWAGLLGGGFMAGLVNGVEGQRQHIPSWGRLGSSFTLVLAAGAWVLAATSGAATRYAVAIAIGMALGFVGDLFNAGVIIEDGLIGGIVAFGLGHIAYISGCVVICRAAHMNTAWAWGVGIGCWQLVGIIGWVIIVYWGREMDFVSWAALPYTLLLSGTAGVTMALALQARQLVSLALGGALFLLSDLILAIVIFRGSFPWSGDLVWLTYGPGQMLIVYSTLAVISVLRQRTKGEHLV